MITPSVSAFTGASRTHVPFIRFFFFFRSSIAFHRLLGISPRYFLQNPLKCCTVNDISDTVFRKWLKQYDEGGLEALVRADAEIKEVLPEGVDRTKEFYKREILRLCIENERLKKLCGADEQGWANGVCLFKNEEFKIVDMLSRDFAITDICAMMGVSRAGYYKWKRRDPSRVTLIGKLWWSSLSRCTRNILPMDTVGWQLSYVMSFEPPLVTTLFASVFVILVFSRKHVLVLP